jgi:phospholipid/cholesterol/gamma-HCH transport system permease protein
VAPVDAAPPDPTWRDRAARAPVTAIEAVGAWALGFSEPVEEIGRCLRIGVMGLANGFIPPFRPRLIIQQCEFIGVQSLPIIVLTSAFTGAVFALQSYRAFALFQAESMVGGTVGVALTRELGPTLTGLLVTGRAGSAIAAEIGSMRVSEQIDALDAMAVDPISYLVKPRLWAAMLMMPLLTAAFDAIGVFGSWFICIQVLDMSEPEFMVRLRDWVDWDDIWSGLLKAWVFGVIMGTVACYKGYYTKGGAKGVGIATTTSVVVSSVAILIANFFIAWMLP